MSSHIFLTKKNYDTIIKTYFKIVNEFPSALKITLNAV